MNFIDRLLNKAYGKKWVEGYYALPYTRRMIDRFNGTRLLTINLFGEDNILKGMIEREVNVMVKAVQKVERRKGINKESTG